MAPNYQLMMRSGPTPGQTYPLEQEEMLVGRDQANDIAINDAEVSRRHARLTMREETILLEDLGSTNGTFLNGERISSPQQLRSGDVITLGENIVIVFEKIQFDPDATVIASHEPHVFRHPDPELEAFQPLPETDSYQQPQPPGEGLTGRSPEMPAPRASAKKKGGFPTWLIILIIAIVVVACVIAVTLWFMPASWWCAIDVFDMIEACPVP